MPVYKQFLPPLAMASEVPLLHALDVVPAAGIERAEFEPGSRTAPGLPRIVSGLSCPNACVSWKRLAVVARERIFSNRPETFA